MKEEIARLKKKYPIFSDEAIKDIFMAGVEFKTEECDNHKKTNKYTLLCL